MSAAAGRRGDEAGDGGVDGVGHRLVPGDQPGQAVGAVLGLDDDVDGREVGRRGGVGDDDDLGRTGERRRARRRAWPATSRLASAT